MPTGYKPVQFKGFGAGLNLRDGPDVVQEDQAIDALNVLFTTRGSVEQRSGYAEFNFDLLPADADSLAAFYKNDGTKQLVVGMGTKLRVLDQVGATVADKTTGITASPHFFQRFGGPTAEHIYIANGVDPVRRWTGAAFEDPTYAAVVPSGKFLGLSSTDNRLVSARFSGALAGNNPSTVRFSSEGDPLNFPSTYYVDLTPGDGEEIMGIASWRDLVIVFKRTKFFVFYGNSVDDDGEPVFNYRPVDAGVGLIAPRAMAVSEQGVYFLAQSGIYFTSGSQPARVSDIVEPIFHGGASVYYRGGELNHAAVQESTMVYHDERLWFSFPSGTNSVNDKQLVFDPNEKWWSLTNLPAGPMVNFRPVDREELIFGQGIRAIGRYYQGGYLTDQALYDGTGGVSIDAYWQSGWFNYGNPVVKTIREQVISGTGLVNVELFRDYRLEPSISYQQIELSAGRTLWDSGVLWDSGWLWGPVNTVSVKSLRKAIRGESFSVRLSNYVHERNFKVHRLTNHIREVRVPSVTKVN